MAQPRRKHPGINVIGETLQGRVFLQTMSALVGGNASYEPVEQVRGDAHVFRISGRHGWGLFVGRKERRVGDEWHGQCGFRLIEPAESGVIVQSNLVFARWDPWLAFGYDDDSRVRKATRKQRKEWELQRAARGTKQDRLELQATPAGTSPDLCGIDADTIASIALRHARPAPTPGGRDTP